MREGYCIKKAHFLNYVLSKNAQKMENIKRISNIISRKLLRPRYRTIVD